MRILLVPVALVAAVFVTAGIAGAIVGVISLIGIVVTSIFQTFL